MLEPVVKEVLRDWRANNMGNAETIGGLKFHLNRPKIKLHNAGVRLGKIRGQIL